MDEDDKKVINKSIKEVTITAIVIAFIITIAVCVAGLIFSLPS